MKTCFKCGQPKDLTEFYAHPMMKDGRLGKCKECTKRDVKERSERKHDYILAYDRNRASLPHRVEARKIYNRTEAGKAVKRKFTRTYRKANPQKNYAHRAVQRAIERGALVRQACEVCGGQKAHAHHDDYSKPLNVRWLCPTHHQEYHRKMKEKL